MDSGIKKVLELISKGKITSEDGERLIKEILRKEKNDNNENNSINVNGNEFPIKKVIFTSLNGDTKIIGGEKNKIDLKANGKLYGNQEGDAFVVKSVNAEDIIIYMDKNLDIQGKLVSGDLDLRDIEGNISIVSVTGDIKMNNIGNTYIKSVSGDILAEDLKGDISINSVSGDISLKVSNSNNISVNAEASDIKIMVPKNSGININCKSERGEIKKEMKFDRIIRETDNLLIAEKGDKQINIAINSRKGDILIGEY